MPNFDRGFIKWQPFNSVISNKIVLDNISKKEKYEKPTLFSEKEEIINNKIIEAYYSKSNINITIYEQNQIRNFNTKITKIHPNNNTIQLNNHKIISFNQIINIK